MPYDEIYCAELTHMVRDVFNSVQVRRTSGRGLIEWHMLFTAPTEICLGTTYSHSLKMIRLLRAHQLLSQKSGRIGLTDIMQYPIQVEDNIRAKMLEVIENRISEIDRPFQLIEGK